MKLWNVILATLVIFGAGVLTGALAAKLSQRPAVAAVIEPQAAPKQQPQRPQQLVVNKEFLGRLNERLALSTNQFVKIEEILKESSDRTRKIAKDEARLVREKIQAELTDDQKKKFDEGIKVRVHPKVEEKGVKPGKKQMDPNKAPSTE